MKQLLLFILIFSSVNVFPQKVDSCTKMVQGRQCDMGNGRQCLVAHYDWVPCDDPRPEITPIKFDPILKFKLGHADTIPLILTGEIKGKLNLTYSIDSLFRINCPPPPPQTIQPVHKIKIKIEPFKIKCYDLRLRRTSKHTGAKL